MKTEGVLVWPVKKDTFWSKFGCRIDFASANHTVVFDKSAMYDTSFSTKELTFYIYASNISILLFRLNLGLWLGLAPQFRTKVARVRFWIKVSWRLWFGIWVLYFHRMLNITYQVFEVDWPLTLSAKIGSHVTWKISYLPPMEKMEFLRIADVLSAVFQLDQHFFCLQWKIQMIFSELLKKMYFVNSYKNYCQIT